MYKAYKKRRKKRTDISDDETEASADEGRADPGTAESEQTASAAEGTLGRGTRRAATSTDYGGPVTRRRRADDGEAEQTRRAKRGRGSRTLRRSAGGCTKRLGAAGTRGTMWKTASASPPSGGRPRLVADHTHKEPCTKTAGRGPVPFYPSPSRGVRFIYFFSVSCRPCRCPVLPALECATGGVAPSPPHPSRCRAGAWWRGAPRSAARRWPDLAPRTARGSAPPSAGRVRGSSRGRRSSARRVRGGRSPRAARVCPAQTASCRENRGDRPTGRATRPRHRRHSAEAARRPR
mmetsp:Transcript_11495/g.33756  ORF Transcript_11495/g.33756 Transcript_11495/m.33756 type:complete len:292 (-) Transcript_11495:480-1355(-)